MTDVSLFWRDKNAAAGVSGTGLTETTLGLAAAGVNCLYDQFLLPISNNRRGFVLRGTTYIKLLEPLTGGGHKHRVFGTDEDLTFAYAEQKLDTGTSFQAGKDYYIYLVAPQPDTDGGADLVVSLNSTFPSGYTADNSRKIGGFHTLCVGVGTIASHPLSGMVAGDIIPASMWDLLHRPTCSPEGMAYVEPLHFWADIYLQSGNGAATVSAFGGTCTDNQIWAAHVEDLFSVGKTLLTDSEFACCMEGSNQKTAIAGATDAVTTGGHLDTAGRRMISSYGLEDGCGFMNQWLDNPSANGGSSWTTQTGGKGDLYGTSCALLAGGSWINGADCGSRCRYADNSRLSVYAIVGGRGRASSR